MFVEIDYDKTETVWGMRHHLQTSARTDAEAKALRRFSACRFHELKPKERTGPMAKLCQINRTRNARKWWRICGRRQR